jgi:hypothetical protein
VNSRLKRLKLLEQNLNDMVVSHVATYRFRDQISNDIAKRASVPGVAVPQLGYSFVLHLPSPVCLVCSEPPVFRPSGPRLDARDCVSFLGFASYLSVLYLSVLPDEYEIVSEDIGREVIGCKFWRLFGCRLSIGFGLFVFIIT